MTKKNLLDLVKGKVEGKGLTWLGRRTSGYCEKLHIIFIATDMENETCPIGRVIDAFGLTNYFNTLEKSDVILVGVNRDFLSKVENEKLVQSLPTEILEIEDVDKEVRYTSVTMYASMLGGIKSFADNVNIIESYETMMAERFESGTLDKADMMNMVILHRTFVTSIVNDNNFIAGVRDNNFSFWSVRKILKYLVQKHIEVFTSLSGKFDYQFTRRNGTIIGGMNGYPFYNSKF
nr:MAG TPA: hypothetical protein [Caudoviricetes sp.]